MTHRSDAGVDIAVIGMDCVFPQAPDVRSFWENIINGVNAIGDPLPSWQSDVHLERRGETSTDQGGYLKDLFRIEPAKFGIMPKALDGGEPDQFIALDLAARALADAGAAYAAPDFDHTDTGVIVGHSPYYHRGQVNTAQHHVFIEQFRQIVIALLPHVTEPELMRLEEVMRDQLPPFVPDITPGLVPNVLTGRIANRLNLRGPNYMIDAACASSLLAVQAAVDELTRGNSRMMLVGGINASLPAEVAIIFTQLGALSDTGKVRPFSSTAAGTLLGEGAGMVVLKRLDDAIADGDRVYSVIQAVGQSSDGRGLGLLSPSKDGEVLAMRRAYDAGGIDPASISLIEAHGTGIPLGDKTEIQAMTEIFGARQGPEGKIAIGSVKSMISHCIPAAGIAGIIKTSLALHHKIQPQTLCDEIKPELNIPGTALFVNTSTRPWIHKAGAPRRAGVNAFGFGGVNAHVILEEAPEETVKPLALTPWDKELFVFAAKDRDALKAQLFRVETFVTAREDARLSEVAKTCWLEAEQDGGPVRLSIVASDAADLIKKIAQAIKKIDKSDKPFATRNGLSFRAAPLEGKLAFMFAGEGSQYMGMFEDLACRFGGLRQWLDFWSASAEGTGEMDRTDIFYPRASELDDAKKAQLTLEIYSMSVGSEAAFLGGQAMFDLLSTLDVQPDAMVGHSTGESSALVAAGVVQAKDTADMLARFREITAISREVNDGGQVPTGALLAVGLLSRDDVAAVIKGTNAVIAMENCPSQTIVFVEGDGADAVQASLTEKGAVVERLPFDRGYHTAGFKPMQDAFEAFYKRVGVKKPRVPLYSCATAAPFGGTAKQIVALAGQQWSQSVRFIDTIKAMYEDGVRAFVEVAPGGKLTSFARQVIDVELPDADVLVAASNLESKSGLESLLHLLGQLFAHGFYAPAPVFAGRALTAVDLDALKTPKRKGVQLDNSIPRIEPTEALVAMLQELGLTGVATGGAAPVVAANAAPTAAEIPGRYGLIERAHMESEDRLEAEVFFDIDTVGFLQDHCLSGPVSQHGDLWGMSCVPFMVSLEAMAEAAAMLLGRRDLGLVENMTGEGWVWADTNATRLRVVAVQTGPETVRTEVWFAGARAVSATLTFGPCTPQAPALPPVSTGHDYNWPEPFQMYRENIFHGPLFQTIDTVTRWAPDGIEATLSDVAVKGFVENGKDPDFIVNPALFDAFTQITAFWLAQERGQFFASFPNTIARMELYNAPAGEAQGLWLRSRQIAAPVGGNDGTWATDCFMGDRLVVRLTGMQNAFSELPQNYYHYSLEPVNGWLGVPAQVSEDYTQLVWDMPALEKGFWRRVGGVFHRVLAFSTLGAEERRVWHTLKNDPDARESYLMQRVALKEAIRWWVNALTGERLHSADITLYEHEQGLWGADIACGGLSPVMQVMVAPEGMRVILGAQGVSDDEIMVQETETEPQL